HPRLVPGPSRLTATGGHDGSALADGRDLVRHPPAADLATPRRRRDAADLREHRAPGRLLGSAGGHVPVVSRVQGFCEEAVSMWSLRRGPMRRGPLAARADSSRLALVRPV